LFDAHGKGWIVAELVDRLKKSEAWHQWKPWAATFDTEAMKRLLEGMAADAGVEVWYYTQVTDVIVENGVVRGLVVEGKSGREAVFANVVIDCTGDGDVAARAGASYRLGRAEDGLCQPMTLMFEIEGVSQSDRQNSAFELYDKISSAGDAHEPNLPLPFERASYTPWVINLPRPGAAAVQATHIYRMNALNTRDVSTATIEGRRQVENLMKLLVRVPGLEHIRLTQTAPAIGVREGRRICGRYTLDLDDLKTGRQFEDAVTVGRFLVDIHEVDPQTKLKSAHGTPTRPYEIPYRSLLPEKLRGLLVAGRCISGTHEAHASYRVTGTCMGMGQAAGLASALCAHRKMMPDAVDGRELRESLAARGVEFLDRSAARFDEKPPQPSAL
jgi:hypothetical protein